MKIFDSYNESIKKLLNAAEEDKNISVNICGMPADIINVDGKYTVAIGVAIGQLINNIITPSAGNAKYLIDFFKKNGGRATFMPLDIILPRKNSDEIKQAIKEKGVIAIATEVVKYEPIYSNVISYLLGDTLICNTIEDAIVIAKKYLNKFKIVTLEGELISKNGVITGGNTQKSYGKYFEKIKLE